MSKIHIHTEKPSADIYFISGPESYLIRFSIDELWNITDMITICTQAALEDTALLEGFVLREIHDLFFAKYESLIKRGTLGKQKPGANFRIRRSSAYTLFTWMNEYPFEHPLHNSLSAKVVDVLYKQAIG